jgi:hypothetical protein
VLHPQPRPALLLLLVLLLLLLLCGLSYMHDALAMQRHLQHVLDAFAQ